MKRNQPQLAPRRLGILPKIKRKDALATGADEGRLRIIGTASAGGHKRLATLLLTHPL